MANIFHNDNYSRKAHRLDIPIALQYNAKQYKIENWSTIGVAVRSAEMDLQMLEIGQEIQAVLVLPTNRSAISLEVTLVLKNVQGNLYGFEIVEIEERNRRVLRHYATLAIEGEPDKLDALLSDLLMPAIQTPIKEPILLSETEDKMLHRSFMKRVVSYGVVTVLVIIFALGVFLYNYSVMYNTTGVISGNIEKVKAPKAGEIKELMVERGEHVKAGMPLFQIDADQDEYTLEAERLKLIALTEKKQRLVRLQRELLAVKQKPQPQEADDDLLSDPQQTIASETEKLNRATRLFEQHLITLNHYNDALARYENFMQRYERRLLTNASLSDQSRKILAADLVEEMGYDDAINDISKSILGTKLRISELQRSYSENIGRANHDGSVFSVMAREGELVKYSETILVLNTDEQPYVLTKLSEEKVVDVVPNQPCIIYSVTTNRKYRGHVEAVGYASDESVVSSMSEISQHEVPVRIVLEDKSLRFPLNQHVDVWILKPSNRFRQYLDDLLWM